MLLPDRWEDYRKEVTCQLGRKVPIDTVDALYAFLYTKKRPQYKEPLQLGSERYQQFYLAMPCCPRELRREVVEKLREKYMALPDEMFERRISPKSAAGYILHLREDDDDVNVTDALRIVTLTTELTVHLKKFFARRFNFGDWQDGYSTAVNDIHKEAVVAVFNNARKPEDADRKNRNTLGAIATSINHKFMDYVRGLRKEPLLQGDLIRLDKDGKPIENEPGEEDERLSPEHLDRVLRHDRLRAVINGLPPDKREILKTRYTKDGLRSYEEMASLLRLPLGTVKSRLNRANILIKDRIGEWESDIDAGNGGHERG